MKQFLIIILTISTIAELKSQERFFTNYSEQGYLLNPSFAGMLKTSRFTVSASVQGYSKDNFKNFQAAGSFYNDNLNGGMEGYSIVNMEGHVRHSIIAMQLSKFFHLKGKWSLSLGVAPEIHNWSVNSAGVILESNINGVSGINPIFPSQWGGSLSMGVSLFSENQVIGFSVQNIFNKTNITEDGLNSPNIMYIGSYGGNFDLNPFSSVSSKRFIRPHFVTIINSLDISFFYGGYYGSSKSQFGMFFVSSSKSLLLGISPSYMIEHRGLRMVFSIKIFPKLPSMYVAGNEVVLSVY
ncbi:MAG: type IX secretion system membrane protein PorP/SprF [Salinivirgaceae bacterium]|nr:type IX secretion system membrane protein PorP/SprF [Salinivirgaceae bacterium]MDD4747463.1 type IX secretion system membrane protein PorP/SprF [Salinivirgaceae bacterium]MDY0281918.1 type IX secretion system membrane protein PorP/SprF [Salinivirgaceae bacterium]